MPKISLRNEAKTRRLQLARETPGGADRAAGYFLSFFKATLFKDSLTPVVALYYPMGSELSTLPLLKALATLPVSTALPRVSDDRLSFHLWSWGDPLEHDAFGFSCPLESAPRVSPDLLIIPLLAFDEEGHRLGYGKGHYDKTLPLYPDALKVGYAYEGQGVETLPRLPHDVALDFVVTNRQVKTFRMEEDA